MIFWNGIVRQKSLPFWGFEPSHHFWGWGSCSLWTWFRYSSSIWTSSYIIFDRLSFFVSPWGEGTIIVTTPMVKTSSQATTFSIEGLPAKVWKSVLQLCEVDMLSFFRKKPWDVDILSNKPYRSLEYLCRPCFFLCNYPFKYPSLKPHL